jgi:hypothetical protein
VFRWKKKMTDSQTIKLSRSAFKRGFDDVITLRPLREAITGSAPKADGKSSSGERWIVTGIRNGSFDQRESAKKKG